jgi:hypothetical protein
MLFGIRKPLAIRLPKKAKLRRAKPFEPLELNA